LGDIELCNKDIGIWYSTAYSIKSSYADNRNIYVQNRQLVRCLQK